MRNRYLFIHLKRQEHFRGYARNHGAEHPANIPLAQSEGRFCCTNTPDPVKEQRVGRIKAASEVLNIILEGSPHEYRITTGENLDVPVE